MPQFKEGAKYTFRQRKLTGTSTKNPAKNNLFRFVKTVNAQNIHLYVFKSVMGEWLETFTPEQLTDYVIERVA